MFFFSCSTLRGRKARFIGCVLSLRVLLVLSSKKALQLSGLGRFLGWKRRGRF